MQPEMIGPSQEALDSYLEEMRRRRVSVHHGNEEHQQPPTIPYTEHPPHSNAIPSPQSPISSTEEISGPQTGMPPQTSELLMRGIILSRNEDSPVSSSGSAKSRRSRIRSKSPIRRSRSSSLFPNSPPPRSLSIKLSPRPDRSPTLPAPKKKPSLACLFCRQRKIACGAPLPGSSEKRCK